MSSSKKNGNSSGDDDRNTGLLAQGDMFGDQVVSSSASSSASLNSGIIITSTFASSGSRSNAHSSAPLTPNRMMRPSSSSSSGDEGPTYSSSSSSSSSSGNLGNTKIGPGLQSPTPNDDLEALRRMLADQNSKVYMAAAYFHENAKLILAAFPGKVLVQLHLVAVIDELEKDMGSALTRDQKQFLCAIFASAIDPNVKKGSWIVYLEYSPSGLGQFLESHLAKDTNKFVSALPLEFERDGKIVVEYVEILSAKFLVGLTESQVKELKSDGLIRDSNTGNTARYDFPCYEFQTSGFFRDKTATDLPNVVATMQKYSHVRSLYSEGLEWLYTHSNYQMDAGYIQELRSLDVARLLASAKSSNSGDKLIQAWSEILSSKLESEIDFNKAPFGNEVRFAPEVIRVMTERVDDAKVVENGLYWIWLRARNPSKRQQLVSKDVGEAIKLGMEMHLENVIIQRFGCLTAIPLSISSESENLLDAGLGKCIIDAMREFPNDIDIQVKGCAAIDGFLRVESNIRILKEQGLTEQLIAGSKQVSEKKWTEPGQVIERKRQAPECFSRVLGILVRYNEVQRGMPTSSSSSASALLASQSGTKTRSVRWNQDEVLKEFEKGIRREQPQDILDCLERIRRRAETSRELGRKEIIERKFLNRIKKAMTEYSSNSSIQACGCEILYWLALNDNGRAKKLVKFGERVIEAMKNHANDPEIQERACWAMRQLLNPNTKKNRDLKSQELVDLIAKSIPVLSNAKKNLKDAKFILDTIGKDKSRLAGSARSFSSSNESSDDTDEEVDTIASSMDEQSNLDEVDDQLDVDANLPNPDIPVVFYKVLESEKNDVVIKETLLSSLERGDYKIAGDKLKLNDDFKRQLERDIKDELERKRITMADDTFIFNDPIRLDDGSYRFSVLIKVSTQGMDEELMFQTVEVNEVCSEEQKRKAIELYEKAKAILGQKKFKRVYFLILVPKFESLRAQTEERVIRAGLAIGGKKVVFMRGVVGGELKRELERFRRRVLEEPDTLSIIVADECHYDPNVRGVHNTALNDDNIVNRPNFLTLLVSATAQNCLTSKSRIRRDNIVEWDAPSEKTLYRSLDYYLSTIGWSIPVDGNVLHFKNVQTGDVVSIDFDTRYLFNLLAFEVLVPLMNRKLREFGVLDGAEFVLNGDKDKISFKSSGSYSLEPKGRLYDLLNIQGEGEPKLCEYKHNPACRPRYQQRVIQDKFFAGNDGLHTILESKFNRSCKREKGEEDPFGSKDLFDALAILIDYLMSFAYYSVFRVNPGWNEPDQESLKDLGRWTTGKPGYPSDYKNMDANFPENWFEDLMEGFESVTKYYGAHPNLKEMMDAAIHAFEDGAKGEMEEYGTDVDLNEKKNIWWYICNEKLRCEFEKRYSTEDQTWWSGADRVVSDLFDLDQRKNGRMAVVRVYINEGSRSIKNGLRNALEFLPNLKKGKRTIISALCDTGADPLANQIEPWVYDLPLGPEGKRIPRNQDLSFMDLEYLPCLVVLTEKGRMGDTFPQNFKYLDLRVRHAGSYVTFVQELGRICRYPKCELEGIEMTRIEIEDAIEQLKAFFESGIDIEQLSGMLNNDKLKLLCDIFHNGKSVVVKSDPNKEEIVAFLDNEYDFRVKMEKIVTPSANYEPPEKLWFYGTLHALPTAIVNEFIFENLKEAIDIASEHQQDSIMKCLVIGKKGKGAPTLDTFIKPTQQMKQLQKSISMGSNPLHGIDSYREWCELNSKRQTDQASADDNSAEEKEQSKVHYDSANTENKKLDNRLMLSAQCQQGKTQVYIEFLKLAKENVVPESRLELEETLLKQLPQPVYIAENFQNSTDPDFVWKSSYILEHPSILGMTGVGAAVNCHSAVFMLEVSSSQTPIQTYCKSLRQHIQITTKSLLSRLESICLVVRKPDFYFNDIEKHLSEYYRKVETSDGFFVLVRSLSNDRESADRRRDREGDDEDESNKRAKF